MKLILYITIFILGSILLLVSSCNSCSNNKPSTAGNDSIVIADTSNIKDTITVGITGDFNGDGKTEKVWLEHEEYDDKDIAEDCCDCKIYFANKKIPHITIKTCVGGTPQNLGDLDEDGADEIGLLPKWISSCWQTYYVYTLKNGKWQYLIDPVTVHCDLFEDGYIPVQKVGKGKILVCKSNFGDEGIETICETITLKNQ